jgi:hypothetical protein
MLAIVTRALLVLSAIAFVAGSILVYDAIQSAPELSRAVEVAQARQDACGDDQECIMQLAVSDTGPLLESMNNDAGREKQIRIGRLLIYVSLVTPALCMLFFTIRWVRTGKLRAR